MHYPVIQPISPHPSVQFVQVLQHQVWNIFWKLGTQVTLFGCDHLFRVHLREKNSDLPFADDPGKLTQVIEVLGIAKLLFRISLNEIRVHERRQAIALHPHWFDDRQIDTRQGQFNPRSHYERMDGKIRVTRLDSAALAFGHLRQTIDHYQNPLSLEELLNQLRRWGIDGIS